MRLINLPHVLPYIPFTYRHNFHIPCLVVYFQSQLLRVELRDFGLRIPAGPFAVPFIAANSRTLCA